MSPWNYPISLAVMPLATAIAAGNRAMLKPSEFTPATNQVLTAMLRETFPEDQVAVVSGDAEIGAAFAALPFDHLIFTGSTKVGRSVMRAASDNLVPVTLELGGKSPAIVDSGYPLARAAASIAFGRLANAGQTVSPPTMPSCKKARYSPSPRRTNKRCGDSIPPAFWMRPMARSSMPGTRDGYRP